MQKLRIWLPSLSGVAISLYFALTLPMFAGFDEPAHLSSVLSFATGQGQPKGGQAYFHASVEKAMTLTPTPIHQLIGWREKVGGYSYTDWARLDTSKKEELTASLHNLEVRGWQDSNYFKNWQAQHPPLYYFVLGHIVHFSGLTNFCDIHTLARVVSALFFSSTFFVLTYYVVFLWGYPLATLWWAIFLPMLYVLGVRISTDAATIPLFSLTLLQILSELKKKPEKWALSEWIKAGLFAALTLGTKAYPLLLIPVMGLIALYYGVLSYKGQNDRIKRLVYPLLPLAIMLLCWSWWLWGNYVRTGSITGQAELTTLKQMGLDTLSAQIDATEKLYTIWLPQTMLVWGGIVAHILFVSNWLVGLAPPVFYVVQAVTFLMPFVWYFRKNKWRGFERAETWFFALILGGFFYGYFKFVVDFYLYFGKPTWVGGWYIWGAAAVFVTFVGQVFLQIPARLRYLIVMLQALCFVTALLTSIAYQSGRYERHHQWKYPVRVGP
jgi:hypothetical protein